MVRTLSETDVIPVAGMILTFALCYELIQLIIENTMYSRVTLDPLFAHRVRRYFAPVARAGKVLYHHSDHYEKSSLLL